MNSFVLLSVVFTLVSSECLEKLYKVLSYYNTVTYDYEFADIEVLVLYDSSITFDQASTYFRSLIEVHVFGRFVDETCLELLGEYTMFGCNQDSTTAPPKTASYATFSLPTGFPVPTSTQTPSSTQLSTTSTSSTTTKTASWFTLSPRNPVTFAPRTSASYSSMTVIIAHSDSVAVLATIIVAA